MTAVEFVGWPLIHFLWQGAAISLILAVALEGARRRGPALRYGLSIAALAIMALMPLATGIRLALRDRAVSVAPARLTTERPAAGVPSDVQLNDGRIVGGNVTLSSAALERSSAKVAQPLSDALPWLVTVWLAGVLLLSVRLIGGWSRARTLVRTGSRSTSDRLEAVAAGLMRRMGITRAIQILESAVVEVPAVVGWLRPVILIPVSALTGLTPQQLELLLAHELAHIRRHDYGINLLQSVVETLFFYHPAVWWVSRRIRQEREHCCDDLAVSICGDPKAYARTLLQLEQLRSPDLGLAAAATGGQLLTRVQRVLRIEPDRSEFGPRWAAGALSLATVLLVLAGINQGADASSPPVAGRHRPGAAQGRGAPDTVIKHIDTSASFATRMEWGTRQGQSLRKGKYWIGYLVNGSDRSDESWIYFDRHVPVTAKGTTLYGHMRLGNPGQLSFSGVALQPLLGNHAANDIAIFYGYEVRNGRPALSRIHVGSFGLPVDFGGWSLVWLGNASNRESVALARSLYHPAGPIELNKDVVSLVGIHSTPGDAVPILLGWLDSDTPEAIRVEATEWIAHHEDPRVLPALSRVARSDPSRKVQQEAAEALGEVVSPQAVDTIISIARSHPDRSVRQEAVETLGEREEPKAFEALGAIAMEDSNREVQMEAIETLGDFRDGKGVPKLIELAQSHPAVDGRREAVETLGEAVPEARTVEILLRIARSDPSGAVRREAVETLGEMDEVPEARQALERMIEDHPDPEVQKQGVEALANRSGGESFEMLREIARTHPQRAVRQEALDGLANSEDPRAIEILKAMALTDSDPSIQRAAAEALGEAHPHDAAITALQEVIWQHPAPEVASAAVEALGDIDNPGVLPVLRDVIRRHPAISVQRQAVEVLAELQGKER